MLKSFTGHYHVAGQTSFDLTALKKNFKNSKNIEEFLWLQKYYQIRFLWICFTYLT